MNSIIVLPKETAALVRPQSGVETAVCQQALVITFLDDASAVDNDQTVHRGDGR